MTTEGKTRSLELLEKHISELRDFAVNLETKTEGIVGLLIGSVPHTSEEPNTKATNMVDRMNNNIISIRTVLSSIGSNLDRL